MKRYILIAMMLAIVCSPALANDQVRWSANSDDAAQTVQAIVDAGKAIAAVWKKLKSHHPVVRFSKNEPGGVAVVPLWPYDPGSRCSPNFDKAPFDVAEGNEIWVQFEFINITFEDQQRIAFAIKADKPKGIDRYRAEHDIGNGRVGNKPRMRAKMALPTSGDYAYYFLDRGVIKTDEILRRNPNAAIKITILVNPRGGKDD